MDSDDSECNAEFTVLNTIYEAYLRSYYNMRRRAFLCLKKVLI